MMWFATGQRWLNECCREILSGLKYVLQQKSPSLLEKLESKVKNKGVKMSANKIGAVGVVIGLLVGYGIKHIAHKQCIRGALEMRCHGVMEVTVPWWLPISRGYPCSAQLKRVSDDGTEKIINVSFIAKRIRAIEALADVVKEANGKEVADDWEPNMGFWGWIGDDYRIQELKVK